MKTIIEVVLALIFSAVIGTRGMRALSFKIKKETVLKVSRGLGSLEKFTRKMTIN